MATVTKDFKIKHGLIVEGTTGTINGEDILTKKQGDQDYIIGLIGGSSDSANTPNTVVKRDGNGDFAAGTITADLVGDVTGNADTATALQTARTIQLTGDVTGSVSFDGTANVQISTTLDGSFATDSEVANAKSEAISTAESYADGVASQAYANATSYTDNAINNIPENYITSTTQDFQVTNGELSVTPYTFDAYGSASDAYNNAVAHAEGYTDNAVAALVDAAPATLDTLNELAAALQDNPNVITDLNNIASGKQDALTAGNGIVIDANNLIYVPTSIGSGISVTPSTVEIDRTTVDTWYDASGLAAQAYANATSYADSLASDYDASGAAANAQVNANAYTDSVVGALTTDDIEEGLNHEYFTSTRAKIAAADLITNATKTNITITGDQNGLTITAENGVADSTTDDLDEGSSNLYFSNARAISAVSGADITPNTVTIDTYRKEEATQQYVSNASTVNVHTMAYPYESVKYLVRVVGWDGGVKHSQITEILMTIDGNSNIAITEYGNVHTSTNPLATFSATIVTGSPTLTATTAVNGCEVIAAATMLSWAD